jgi:hypothetical protein
MADPHIATMTISVKLPDGSHLAREICLTAAAVAAGDINDGFRRGCQLVLNNAIGAIEKAIAND